MLYSMVRQKRNKFTEPLAAIYNSRFLEKAGQAEAFYWRNNHSQLMRFKAIFKHIDFSLIPHIHDAGCGDASFHTYLLEKNLPHVYSGSDIAKESLLCAKEMYPDISLFQRCITDIAPFESYKYIIQSGLFNLKPSAISRKNWEAHCFNILQKMFAAAESGIVFNFLPKDSRIAAKDRIYFDREKMYLWCKKQLSSFMVMDESYSLYDTTIAIYKSD